MPKTHFIKLLVFVLVLVTTALILKPKSHSPGSSELTPNPQSTTSTLSTSSSTPLTHPNITIDDLVEGSQITSNTPITGQAKLWYFEGVFNVKILNSSSTVIYQGNATATSDWMTTSFVPFTITPTFPPQTPGSNGQIIFIKDNPSGDPINDDQFVLPITF